MGNGERTQALPDRGLRGAVLGYHGYRRITAAGIARSEAETANVSLLLCFKETPGSTTAEPPSAFVVTGDAAAPLGSGSQAIQIDLTPIGAHRTIGVAPDALVGGEHDAAAIIGPEGPRLIDRLATTSSWHVRFEAVDRFLLERLQHAPPRSLSAGTAWSKFAETGASILVGQLSSVVEDAAEVAQPGAGAASPAGSISQAAAAPVPWSDTRLVGPWD